MTCKYQACSIKAKESMQSVQWLLLCDKDMHQKKQVFLESMILKFEAG